MYEARGQDEILKELQQNVGNDTSNYEGTFTYDVLAANSIEFAKQEVEREQAYKAGFAQTAWGEYLDLRAKEHGIFRKQAVKASGTVTVTGTGIVPLESVFQTPTGVVFHTTKAVTIVSSGDIPIECTTSGEIGNVDANTITIIPMSIPGINSVTNPQATHDGFDPEDDASLYNRLIFKVRQPVTSGNKNEYIQWGNINVGTTDTKVTLPISFSNNAYRVVFTSTWNTEAIGSTLTKEFHNTGRKTTSAFYIKSNYSNAMDWIAIGY